MVPGVPHINIFNIFNGSSWQSRCTTYLRIYQWWSGPSLAKIPQNTPGNLLNPPPPLQSPGHCNNSPGGRDTQWGPWRLDISRGDWIMAAFCKKQSPIKSHLYRSYGIDMYAILWHTDFGNSPSLLVCQLMPNILNSQATTSTGIDVETSSPLQWTTLEMDVSMEKSSIEGGFPASHGADYKRLYPRVILSSCLWWRNHVKPKGPQGSAARQVPLNLDPPQFVPKNASEQSPGHSQQDRTTEIDIWYTWIIHGYMDTNIVPYLQTSSKPQKLDVASPSHIPTKTPGPGRWTNSWPNHI